MGIIILKFEYFKKCGGELFYQTTKDEILPHYLANSICAGRLELCK